MNIFLGTLLFFSLGVFSSASDLEVCAYYSIYDGGVGDLRNPPKSPAYIIGFALIVKNTSDRPLKIPTGGQGVSFRTLGSVAMDVSVSVHEEYEQAGFRVSELYFMPVVLMPGESTVIGRTLDLVNRVPDEIRGILEISPRIAAKYGFPSGKYSCVAKRDPYLGARRESF